MVYCLMSILYPLLTLCSSSVTAYGVCYPESGPNNAFRSHHHPNTHLGAVATPQLTSPRSSTILTTGSAVLQHRGSTACHKNQYATSVPSKRCWLPGGPRQQERSFPASAHPAARPSAAEALALPPGRLRGLSIPLHHRHAELPHQPAQEV